MNTATMPVPVKKCPRSHDAFVTYVRLLVTCLTGNAGFPNPTPSVASLAAQSDSLAHAHARALARGPGVVADRDAKRKDLEDDLDHLLDHIKGAVKSQAADPGAAATLILSTGLSLRRPRVFTKPPLAARNGRLPGEVRLSALAVRSAALYVWEVSLDGVTWTTAPGTTRSTTTLPGLIPGQLYTFRVRVHTPRGLGPASDVVTCRVL